MNNEKWLKSYRSDKSAVWMKIRLTDGAEFFFSDSSGWKKIKLLCNDKNIFIDELYLQFRSHEVKIDIDNAEGLYFVRSILGQMGGASKHYYTTGVFKGGKMHKKMWLIPEVVPEKEYIDELSDCFEEAIIWKHNDEKKKENPQE